MAEGYQEFVEADAEVVAVLRDSPGNAEAYFSLHPIPFPCLVDPDHRVYDTYGVEIRLTSLGQRPATFIIDTEGVVRYAYIGWQQWEIPKVSELLGVCRGLRESIG